MVVTKWSCDKTMIRVFVTIRLYIRIFLATTNSSIQITTELIEIYDLLLLFVKLLQIVLTPNGIYITDEAMIMIVIYY